MAGLIALAASPETVLRRIPGWQNACIEPLLGGRMNTSYRVSKGANVAVLKIDNEPREAPLNSRCDEASVQNAASKAGLAAPVIQAGEGFYFCEYLEGMVWTAEKFKKGGSVELVGESLQRLHALPLTGRTFDARSAARGYLSTCEGLDTTVLKRCTEIVDSMRLPQHLCCSHNDLVAENIMTTPGVMFLDWEYACDNDPLFDLATIVEHHELSEAAIVRLMDVYFDGDTGSWRSHLEKQRKLYLALLCLWLASRTDTDADELRGVVERLLATSCF